MNRNKEATLSGLKMSQTLIWRTRWSVDNRLDGSELTIGITGLLMTDFLEFVRIIRR